MRKHVTWLSQSKNKEALISGGNLDHYICPHCKIEVLTLLEYVLQDKTISVFLLKIFHIYFNVTWQHCLTFFAIIFKIYNQFLSENGFYTIFFPSACCRVYHINYEHVSLMFDKRKVSKCFLSIFKSYNFKTLFLWHFLEKCRKKVQKL